MATPDLTLTLEGALPASAAAWNTSSLLFLPFDVPEGVSAIHVHRDFHPMQKHTVATLLYDARGIESGFRGYQGQVNTDREFTITTDPGTTTRWYQPGPITPGRWHIGHWYIKAVSKTLRYRYTITLTFGDASSADITWPPYDPGVIKSHPGWYVGGLHNHTHYSYDAHIGGKPHSLAGLVRKFVKAGYEFLAVTDHNQPRSHSDAPLAALANPDILLISGNEITTLHGHANTLFVPPGTTYEFRIDPGDGRLPRIIDSVHASGALFVVNHPYQKCADCAWRFPEGEWQNADAVEVWNRPWTELNRQAVDFWDGLLKRGRRITAVGGADYHRGNAPLTPATWVHARELSLSGIKEGIQRGRVFLSESPNGPILYLNTADGRAMAGDIVHAARGMPVPVIVRAEGGAGCTLRLISRFGKHSVRITSRDQVVEHTVSPGPTGRTYLRAELLHPNGDVAALTNPVYVQNFPTDN